jgi:AcrR family transcriptional regulator
VQTVIRRFGGKDGLVAAAAERESTAIRRQRDQAPAGDVTVAVRVLVKHYEAFGDRVLKMLAERERVPALRQIVDRGRALHRDWCTRVFAAALTGRAPTVRRRRLAQLVAVCDVSMWKLLRRDAGLSRRQTELAIVELLIPILKELAVRGTRSRSGPWLHRCRLCRLTVSQAPRSVNGSRRSSSTTGRPPTRGRV